MDEPRWLSDDEQRAWRALAGLMIRLPAALEAQLQRDAGLTQMGYWVLAMLSEEPCHALRMSELAERSNSSPSRLSHLVSSLEQRGWVHRTPAPEDGRGQLAHLTEAGLAKVVATAPGHAATVLDLVFGALTPQEAGTLGELCATVLGHLEAPRAA